MSDVELVLDAGAELGEAPSWDPVTRRLLWVDITPGIVHRFDPASGEDEGWHVGASVGAAAPTDGGRLALAVRDGFAILDPATGRVEPIADVGASAVGTMMNDGKVDPAGRFWAGTKDLDGRRPIGSLFRLGADQQAVRVLDGVTISNGLAWSPDGRMMYYIDSATYGIDAFDFDPESGSVANRRRQVELPRAWGLPDGMTVDAEGLLWVAFWGGSAVRRLSPGGELVEAVDLPVSQVTSCAFGGDAFDELFVTSARDGVPEDRRASQPHAGGVFRLRPDVPGLPERPFAERSLPPP